MLYSLFIKNEIHHIRYYGCGALAFGVTVESYLLVKANVP